MSPANRFWRELALAGLLAVGGAAGHWLLAPLLGAASSLRLSLTAVALLALAAASRQGRRRAGRVVVPALGVLALGLLWALDPALPWWLAFIGAGLWLARVLLRHSRALPALLDGGLTALGVVLALATALRTGSPLLSLWCFLLLPALAALLPGASPTPPAASDQRFDHAQRCAEAALRRLASRP